MEQWHGSAVRLFPTDPRVPFHGAFIDHEMRTRGRYAYEPEYVDRSIRVPAPWPTWIPDVPGGNGGDSDEDDGDDITKENEEDGGKDDDAMEDPDDHDLSSTVVLKRSIQPGESGGDRNMADTDFQSNAHASSSVLDRPRYHHTDFPISIPTNTGGVGNLRERKKPKTVMITNPMANPSVFDEIIRSSRQEPNWKATTSHATTRHHFNDRWG